MSITESSQPTILIRGAGDLATGVALVLFRAGLKRLLLLEQEQPLAVRRLVCFSEAVYLGRTEVEGVRAMLIDSVDQAEAAWAGDEIPVIVDPDMACLAVLKPQVLVDALIAKRNDGVHPGLAPLVVALGPGFVAGQDVHCVVETHRGHGMGNLVFSGAAYPNTGIPGEVAGKTLERLLRAPGDGLFTACRSIGDHVREGDVVGSVGSCPVPARTSGVIRGLLRSGLHVRKGLKLGDVDPRGEAWRCRHISDKALIVGQGVLQAVLAAGEFMRLGPTDLAVMTHPAEQFATHASLGRTG
ncbi:selenium-dependent molybdenum cofactor biosynthesis protein YqeB [Desulfonatronum parangueonense]